MKFYIYTLGCKVNQYESEAIHEAWENTGATSVETSHDADVILINSCAVTENSLKDVRKFCTELATHNFSGKIVLTGCATTLLEKELLAISPFLVVRHKNKAMLLQYNTVTNTFGTGAMESFAISRSTRARPTVKLQDGCSHKCTYCIIPYTRGASVSRSVADILAEIERLLKNGYEEIVLSGINLRQFGLDFTLQMDLWDVVHSIEKTFASEWAGKARFRLSSLEPCQLTEKGLQVLSSSTMLCPHIHISLQSASDSVLERMGRSHYTASILTDAVQKIRIFWPIFALGVDVIAGFPQESEEEYLETLQYLQALPLSYAHVFPFSERPFTKARTMSGQVHIHIRKERAKQLRAVVFAKQQNFLEYMVEKQITQNVVSEKHTKNIGISEYYVRCQYTNTPTVPTLQPCIPISHTGKLLNVASMNLLNK